MAKLGEYGEKLENMTAQEVYDAGALHLLSQNERSLVDGECAYKGENGICCAAAPFIKDYNPEMEGGTWQDIAHTKKHESLISGLQDVHDWRDEDKWPNQLVKLAEEFDLEPHPLCKKK